MSKSPHTTDIFGDPIFTYSYRQAVVEGYLIDHEPPARIETALARAGIAFEKNLPQAWSGNSRNARSAEW